MSTLQGVPRLDKSPPYQQIATYYRDQIRRGERNVGDEFPSIREIMEEWGGVSTHTAQRAVRVLRDEGLIEQRTSNTRAVIVRTPDT